MSKSFKGRLMGVEYDDPKLFERAARSLGYRRGKGSTGAWRVGTAVRVIFNDGTWSNGSVWSQADRKGYVWVALDNGRYVAVYTRTLMVSETTGGTRAPDALGRVA